MENTRQSVGIIVAAPVPGSYRVWLFDRALGHISAVTARRVRSPLALGSLITYTVGSMRDQLILDDIQLQNLPQYGSLLALYFGHHLMQLVHCALPTGYVDEDLFDDIALVLDDVTNLGCDYYRQQLVLGRLCALMGLLADESINATTMLPMEQLLTMSVTPDISHRIQASMLRSLSSYPFVAKLRYLQFIKEHHQ